MLAFRSLDPFRALREPDRRRRDEERLSRSEQRTLSKTQNNHLTAKAPYKFETTFAKQLGVPLLLANVTQQVYQMARAAGLNKEDGSSIIKVFERMAGGT